MHYIPLKEWTEHAQANVDASALANGNSGPSLASTFGSDPSSWPEDARRSAALTSDPYLSSALEVARSLADQICGALGGDDVDVCDTGGEMVLPTSGTGWADKVVVHLDPSEGDKGGAGEGEIQVKLASYHNVVRAEMLLPSTKINGNSNCPEDESQIIFSLGIVFYQIFSGWELSPEMTREILGTSSRQLDDSGDIEPEEKPTVYPSQTGIGQLNFLDDDGVSLENSDREALGNAEERDMPSKKKGPHQENGTKVQSVLVEPLRLKGLPTSLCDMIGNMIDCINGDLSGDEAYHNMLDVRRDLQLMLEKPHRFLSDMDLEKLSVTGLQLQEAMVDRDADLSALKDAYRCSISGKNELGLVVGPSGIGKSVLANQLGSFITATGGLFLTGKFDQLQQPKPFSALASAFNEYCEKMLNDGRSGHLEEVASELSSALGEEAHHLTKIIPNLSIILGDDAGLQGEDQHCVDPQKRLQYLLGQLVDVISSFSGAPVTLFLDDVQWACPASIRAIHQLLVDSSSLKAKRQFFFLASCREEGMHEAHPLGIMLSDIHTFGVNATMVKLACMDKEMANTLVSELLCLSPRLTRSLSEIIHLKTQGSPLFLSQLMMSLCKDGLVRLSLKRRRWIWDEEKIQSRQLPDDVATFLASALGRLPDEVQDALCTLAYFGARSDFVLLQELETRFGCKLIQPLEVAVAEGLLNRLEDGYIFAHDRLQEAAYNLVPIENQNDFHFKYGVALLPRALELQDVGMLFVAAGQINRAGPAAVGDDDQSLIIANLNLTAGQKAIEMSDFASAYSFFDNGISFLPKNHWQDHYALSLSLFKAACKCASLVDIDSLKLLSEQVLNFAESFHDTLDVLYILITSLADARQLPESIEKTIIVLQQLDEELPECQSQSELLNHMIQTKAILEGLTDQQLVEYKQMTDPSKLMAMKFYGRLQLAFMMMKPDAQPLVTMKMCQLSIAYGMSPYSPIAFVFFGHLVAKLGGIKEGVRYVKIARELLDRSGGEATGEVINYSTQLMCLLEPMQSTLEFHLQGHTLAMQGGDTNAALLNSMHYASSLWWSGRHLLFCQEQYAHACRLMEEYNNLTWLSHISEQLKNISLLISSDDRRTSLNGAEVQVEIQDTLQMNNPHAKMGIFYQKMFIRFLFREYEPMKAFADKFFDFHVNTWFMTSVHASVLWASGLVAFWVHRQTREDAWANRGATAKIGMQQFAKTSEWNFQSKAYLLEAEEAFCNNDTENAKLLYDKAISAAKEHRFINELALSSELAGHFYLELEEEGLALQYFMQACESYRDWGAVAKSNFLLGFIEQNIGVVTSSPRPDVPSSKIPKECNFSNRRKRGSE